MTATEHLGKLQLTIMRVLWGAGEATVNDVHEALLESHGLAPTTIATMLKKMERKGVVKHRTEGRRFVYRPHADDCLAEPPALGNWLVVDFDNGDDEASGSAAGASSTSPAGSVVVVANTSGLRNDSFGSATWRSPTMGGHAADGKIATGGEPTTVVNTPEVSSPSPPAKHEIDSSPGATSPSSSFAPAAIAARSGSIRSHDAAMPSTVVGSAPAASTVVNDDDRPSPVGSGQGDVLS